VSFRRGLNENLMTPRARSDRSLAAGLGVPGAIDCAPAVRAHHLSINLHCRRGPRMPCGKINITPNTVELESTANRTSGMARRDTGETAPPGRCCGRLVVSPRVAPRSALGIGALPTVLWLAPSSSARRGLGSRDQPHCEHDNDCNLEYDSPIEPLRAGQFTGAQVLRCQFRFLVQVLGFWWLGRVQETSTTRADEPRTVVPEPEPREPVNPWTASRDAEINQAPARITASIIQRSRAKHGVRTTRSVQHQPVPRSTIFGR
jgi:hypothetical protein